MCNPYSMTKGQQAIRDFVRATHVSSGNPTPLPGIFPDTLAPVVRTAPDGEREVLRMRWGMPCPP
jgi:putative SOS response-associated peptidase YedK